VILGATLNNQVEKKRGAEPRKRKRLIFLNKKSRKVWQASEMLSRLNTNIGKTEREVN
jgi:hypothetical protein